MNVDIRIIIDVTQGELDVFMSPQDDSFIVETNETTGNHLVYLDNRYRWIPDSRQYIHPLNIAQPKYEINSTTKASLNEKKVYWVPHINDCKSLGGSGFYIRDGRAKELSTHVRLTQCNTLLRLFGLKNRLVLTLPQNSHNLSATRFFIALRASPNSEQSYGSVVFRQDQLHIDLFVFFSVFFSCFFLFLAVCVVVWKAKQAADLRRARRQHVVEMLHLAKRPFARIYLSMTPDTDSPILPSSSSATLTNSSTCRSTSRNTSTMRPTTVTGTLLRPEQVLIAIEPTADGVAAVGTVMVSLPGGHKAPVTLALASALIFNPRQYFPISRNYSRIQPRTGPSQNPNQQSNTN